MKSMAEYKRLSRKRLGKQKEEAKYARSWQKKNKQAFAKIVRRYRLKVKYGITLEEYEAMKKAQKGKCLICYRKKKLAVDHNHKDGKIRGLLCVNCNMGLGLFEDNQILLLRAIDYLLDKSTLVIL